MSERDDDHLQLLALLPRARPGEDAISRELAWAIVAGQLGYGDVQRLRADRGEG